MIKLGRVRRLWLTPEEYHDIQKQVSSNNKKAAMIIRIVEGKPIKHIVLSYERKLLFDNPGSLYRARVRPLVEYIE